MPARRPLALLILALAAAAAALAPSAAGQAVVPPPCPPGSPAIPPPTVAVEGSPATPGRVVAGRTFTIEYDEPLGVIVADTLAAAPGTTFVGPADSSSVSPTVPAPGPAPFAVRFYSAEARRGQECTQSLTFTVPVELGDLLPARIGYALGSRIGRGERYVRLPRVGVVSGDQPFAGLG